MAATELETAIANARTNCQRFANIHKIVFEDHGEVGFGRPCVGFRHGGNYIDIHPMKYPDLDEVWPRDNRLGAPSGVEAYHKHDCLCVLALGDEPDYDTAIRQMDAWLRHLEMQGELEVVSYQTGAVGLQALMSGLIGHAIRFKS